MMWRFGTMWSTCSIWMDSQQPLIEMKPEVDHLLVVNVAVSPDHQSRGYGRALLAHAEELALSLQLRELRLYTSKMLTDNVKLYEGVGYEVDREEIASTHLGIFV